MLFLFVKLSTVSFEQAVTESIDAPQRGAQIVRNRIGEGCQFLVGSRELGFAGGYPLFQFGVEPEELLFRSLTFGDIFAKY